MAALVFTRRLLAHTGTSVAILTVTFVVGLALTGVGWLDDRATRARLVDLLRQEADTVRHTVAAAARANRAAAVRAEADLAARLLDNARLLAEIDRGQRLRPELLSDLTARHGLFRVFVFDADGHRELSGGGPGAGGPGPWGGGSGGRGRWGGGGGPHGSQAFGGGVLQRLLAGSEEEAVTELHQSRWGETRIAAGARRPAGGAIVVNADASAIAALQKPYSLEVLLDEILSTTGELAYLTVEQDGYRVSRGDFSDRDILAVRSDVNLGATKPAALTLGMRLGGVREAERQHAVRLAVSFSALLVLAVVGLGFVRLRGRYGDLRVRHDLAHEMLRRGERLAAIGELAGMVAHEIRNPLNAIAMSAQRLRREAPLAADAPAEDREEALALLRVIESESARLNTRVQQLLDYSRPPRLERRDVGLDALLAELGEAARPQALERGVDLAVDVPHATPVRVDPAQLRHALENIVRNGIQATPAGGEVRIRAARDGRETVITVSDTGAGIAAADLPRIFDLYFSTRPEGTGIGLAVAHQVVAAHGGSIDVASEVGRGTVVTIRLPDEDVPHE